MDQDPIPPPDFALPGFTALMALTMATQHIEHDEAIVLLEQLWEQTGLGGVCPGRGDDGNPDRDEEDPPPQPDQNPPHLHEGPPPEEIQDRQDRWQTTQHHQQVCSPSHSTRMHASPQPSPQGQRIMPSSASKHTNTYHFGISPGKDCARQLAWSDSQTRTTLSQ